MTQDLWSAVDRYICDLLVPSDSVLDEVLEESTAAGLPPIAVTPNLGKLLYLIARIQGAESILEIGTLAGYSTIWLARALAPGGRLITLEAEPQHAEIARANLIRAGLADVVELRLGSALDTLPQLAAEGRGPFDLIFVDAEKRDNPAYYEWSMKLAPRQCDRFRQRRAGRSRHRSQQPEPERPGDPPLQRNRGRRPACDRHGNPNGRQQGLRRLRDRAGHGRSVNRRSRIRRHESNFRSLSPPESDSKRAKTGFWFKRPPFSRHFLRLTPLALRDF